ncbi:hypothetical protein KAM469_40400 [Aeromonas caviae]|nr:hypothetical protein KAM469_40400 [Aeromonas caviae]GKR50818.1 hypothetical protein KAM474_42360 [Aeromonas caviae]GKR76494.1 hypothetical protein KAM480_42220 [Aeromonas caviae]GKR84777.1 hypothetical protein KAM482_39880 [Aeromonas caviae]GKR93118.1 hypothetical protein KAM484_39230 [Aeromonas caviae]
MQGSRSEINQSFCDVLYASLSGNAPAAGHEIDITYSINGDTVYVGVSHRIFYNPRQI